MRKRHRPIASPHRNFSLGSLHLGCISRRCEVENVGHCARIHVFCAQKFDAPGSPLGANRGVTDSFRSLEMPPGENIDLWIQPDAAENVEVIEMGCRRPQGFPGQVVL